MKFFVLLFFSSFLYAQEENNNPDGSTRKNTAPQQQEKQNPPAEDQQPDSSKKQGEQNPPVEKQQPDSSKKQGEQKPLAEKQQPDSSKKQEKQPDSSKETGKPKVQQTVAVPQQTLEASPEEPIPYYNPLHPQSPSTYQEGDLPVENLSGMAALKNRTHRFSISGKPFDYRMQGSLKKINFNLSADYGYARKYFEVGPYASLDFYDFDIESDQFADKLIVAAGAFFEVNFMANANHAKNVPSIGLKAGYKRKDKVHYMVGQLYVTMKFFLNPQTALFTSLAPYYQYKFSGQKGEWGVEIPIGLRFYFY